MDLSQGIPLAYLYATGTVYKGSPGDANWVKMLSYFIGNILVWAREPGGNWESLYNPGVSVGTVTATDTFSLPFGILKPSNKAHDYIYVVENSTITNPHVSAWVSGTSYNAGTQVTYSTNIYQALDNLTNDTVPPPSDPLNWALIPPQISKFRTVPGPQLKYYSGKKGVASISGGSIRFSRGFISSDLEYGGTIYLPAFLLPATFKLSPASTRGAIPVDDPMWLLYYSAQEWAQTDTTLIQNVPSLVAKATESMTGMMLDNQRMKTLSPQTPPEGAAYGDTFGSEAGE